MTRVLLSLAVLAFFALCLYGMWHGWQRRARRQAAVLAEFPAVPADPGAVLLETTGQYIGTTIGDNWQDRVAVGDIGHRAEAVLRLTDQGVRIERTGASELWIPRDEARVSRQEVAHSSEVVPTTDRGAWLNEKGRMVIDLTEAPFEVNRTLDRFF